MSLDSALHLFELSVHSQHLLYLLKREVCHLHKSHISYLISPPMICTGQTRAKNFRYPTRDIYKCEDMNFVFDWLKQYFTNDRSGMSEILFSPQEDKSRAYHCEIHTV